MCVYLLQQEKKMVLFIKEINIKALTLSYYSCSLFSHYKFFLSLGKKNV